jgi:2-methylcitrate dehydratase
MDDTKRPDRETNLPAPAMGRRKLIKMGVSAGVAAAGLLAAQSVSGQGQQGGRLTGPLAPSSTDGVQKWPEIVESGEMVTSDQVGFDMFSGPGWVNNSGRAFGNGPMDECTRRIVEWVSGHQLNPTDAFLEAFNYLMLDTVGSLYSGFESEPARINARLAQTMRGDLKCTIPGYGIVTTPEMAAFASAALIRHSDFGASAHMNEMFGGVFAMGEALHASGAKVMEAMAIAYEVISAIGGTGKGNYDPGGFDAPYHSVGVAMACGKLMGLNQDQLGNAVALAMVPHMPMYVTHTGVQSMWKGTHSAEQVRNGVWAALLAQAGMTGPAQPFEGRWGLIAHVGPFTRDLRFPASGDGRTAIETSHGEGRGYKRYPLVGGAEIFCEHIAPDLVAWTGPQEVAAIKMEFNFTLWQEDADPQKWDPRNKETADHSLPFIISRMIMDKEIYLDSFTREKYMDPAVRELMNKVTIHAHNDPAFGNGTRITVRKKSGEERVFTGKPATPMSHDELIAKYNRICDLKQISKAQADRAREQWMNLKDLKDFADAMQVIAKFGQPKPLSDMTPARIS